VGKHQEAFPHPPHHAPWPKPFSDGLVMKLGFLSMADNGTRARREASERGSRGSSMEVGALCMVDTSRTRVSL